MEFFVSWLEKIGKSQNSSSMEAVKIDIYWHRIYRIIGQTTTLETSIDNRIVKILNQLIDNQATKLYFF